ncbi:hypothetical protein AB0M46_39895 [Dactylosporangium sp. NPDC051485]|uniref:hypothetical protein n=1 Tax=Dactylosporangium sp. NPDC051485 TaxID=3154846 RepID=UPI003423967E
MIDLLNRQRGPLSLLIGGLGLLILALVLASRAARRAGGWRVVLRRARREIALTGAASVRPVRVFLVYRKSLRRLTQALGDPATRETARRALKAAGHGEAQPYAVLVGPSAAGVLVAARDPGAAPPPFTADEADPRLWWADPAELPQAVDGDPALVAMGVDGKRGRDLVVYLDLHTGPPLTAGTGDPRTARALIQAVAAQLDLALPPGSVLVTAGVHPGFSGSSVRPGGAAFVVCPEPVDDPGRARVLAIGGARGHARLLVCAKGGLVRVGGVPIDIETAALPKAVARLAAQVPAPPAAGEGERDDDLGPEVEVVTGVSAREPRAFQEPAQVSAEASAVDEFDEPEFDDAAVGRPSRGRETA